MPNGWEPQPYRPPYRVLVVCNPTERYFDATDAERQEICLPRFKQMIGEWAELGARPVSSFVDDVFQVGVPPTPFFSHEETVPHRTVDPEGNS